MKYYILLTTIYLVILQTVGLPTNKFPSNISADKKLRLGIFEGNGTSIEDHPYLVSVFNDNILFCAGSILNHRWILTTAFCVYGYEPKDIQIVAGSQDGFSGTTYVAAKTVVHPQYAGYDYQFACVQIDGKFTWSTDVKPVKLPNRKPKANTELVVAGWGSSEGIANYQLQEGTMKWLNKQVCKKTFSSTGFVDKSEWTNRMACAYDEGKTTLCEGDWGDPFVKNGVLFGHFVAGDKIGFCSSEAKPVLLADVHSVVSWIQQVTGI